MHASNPVRKSRIMPKSVDYLSSYVTNHVTKSRGGLCVRSGAILAGLGLPDASSSILGHPERIGGSSKKQSCRSVAACDSWPVCERAKIAASQRRHGGAERRSP